MNSSLAKVPATAPADENCRGNTSMAEFLTVSSSSAPTFSVQIFAISSRTIWIACAAAIVALTSCRRLPDEVYVPADAFRSRIEATTPQGRSATVRAGEWLTLSVSRTSGPWVRVRRTALAPESCWLAPAPPDHEAQVADNVRWTAAPNGAAEFDVGLREDHSRRVRFARPGRAGRVNLRETAGFCV